MGPAVCCHCGGYWLCVAKPDPVYALVKLTERQPTVVIHCDGAVRQAQECQGKGTSLSLARSGEASWKGRNWPAGLRWAEPPAQAGHDSRSPMCGCYGQGIGCLWGGELWKKGRLRKPWISE